MIKAQLDIDLKTALLASDRLRVDTLRGIKSAILYEEVAQGKRDEGLSDEEIQAVLAKEAKKRQESAVLYASGGAKDRADKELREKAIIEAYLPAKLTDEELRVIVESVIAAEPVLDPKSIGKIISAVKQQAGVSADGAAIARLVKERLT